MIVYFFNIDKVFWYWKLSSLFIDICMNDKNFFLCISVEVFYFNIGILIIVYILLF